MIKNTEKLKKKVIYSCKWWLILIISTINIVFKITFILDIIFQLLIIIFSKIFLAFRYQTITDCFVLNKRNNKIEQIIDFKIYIETWKNDFYEHKEKLLKKITEINLNKNLTSIEGFTNKELSCTTNTIIYYYVLRKYIGRKNLRVNNDETIRIFQPCEKLTFMSPWVVWKHLIIKGGRIKFIKDLYEYDSIRTYYFNIENL